MHTYDARLPRHESDGIAPPTPSNSIRGRAATVRSAAAPDADRADRPADGATRSVETNEGPSPPESA